MANPVPIQHLDTANSPPNDRAIRAVITLSWPYSSKKRHCALLLSDPDFRLRSRKGQVKVNFYGAAARAVAERRLRIGDEVELSLEGAEWAEQEATTTTVATPGKSVGELDFRTALRLRAQREGQVQVEVAVTAEEAANDYAEDDEDACQDQPAATPARRPNGTNPFRSSFGNAPGSFAIYSSPAFARRSRLSYLDGISRLFEDECQTEEQPRKKARVSLGEVRGWRVVSRTPSPVKERFDLPIERETAAEEDARVSDVVDSNLLASNGAPPRRSRSRRRTPVTAETPDREIADSQVMQIDDSDPQTVPQTTIAGEGSESSYADQATSQPMVPEKHLARSSPMRTMLPPALPKLQVPSESLDQAESAREESEGPLTPRLQPVHSGGLPLPSPFPAEPATQHSHPPTVPYSEMPERYAEQPQHSTPQRRPQRRENRPREIQDTYVDDAEIAARFSPQRLDPTFENIVTSSPMGREQGAWQGVNAADNAIDAPASSDMDVNAAGGQHEEAAESLTNRLDNFDFDGQIVAANIPGSVEEVPDSDDDVVEDEVIEDEDVVEESDEFENDDADEKDVDAMLEDDVDEAIDPDDLVGEEPSDDESDDEEDEEDVISQQSLSASMLGQSQAEPTDIDEDSDGEVSPTQVDIHEAIAPGVTREEAVTVEESSPQAEASPPPTEATGAYAAEYEIAPSPGPAPHALAKPVTPIREPSPFVSGFDHLLQRESGFALPAFNMTPVAKQKEAPAAMPQDRTMKHTFKNLFGFRGSQSPEKERFVPSAPEFLDEKQVGLQTAEDAKKSIVDAVAAKEVAASSPTPVESEIDPKSTSQVAPAQESQYPSLTDDREQSLPEALPKSPQEVRPTASGLPPSAAQVVDPIGSSSDVDDEELPANENDGQLHREDGAGVLSEGPADHEDGDSLDLLPQPDAEPPSANPFILAGPEEERRKSEHAVISEGPSDEARPSTRASPLFSRDDADEAMHVAFGDGLPTFDVSARMDLDEHDAISLQDAPEAMQSLDPSDALLPVPEQAEPIYPELPQFDGLSEGIELEAATLVDGRSGLQQDLLPLQTLQPSSAADAAMRSGTSSFRELSSTPSVMPEQALAQPAHNEYEMLDLSQPEVQAAVRPSQSYRLSQASQRGRLSEAELVEDSIDSPQSTVVAESSPHSGQPDDIGDFPMFETEDALASARPKTSYPEDQDKSVLPSVLPSQELGQGPSVAAKAAAPRENTQVASQYHVAHATNLADNAELPPRGTGYTEVIDLGSSSPAPVDHSLAAEQVPDEHAPTAGPDPSLAEHERNDELLANFSAQQAPPALLRDQVRSHGTANQPNGSEHLPLEELSQLPPETVLVEARQQIDGNTDADQRIGNAYPRLPMSPSFSQSQSLGAETHPNSHMAAIQPLPITPMLTETGSDLQAMITATQQSTQEAQREEAHAALSQQEAPLKPAVEPRTPSKKSLRSRLSNVPDVISAWFSPKRSSTVAATIAERDYQESSVTEKIEASPMRYANGYRTDYSYFTSLCSLDKHLNPSSQQVYDSTNTVDVLAVVTDHTKAPERARGGPRDYFTVFHITDASIDDTSSTRVEVFRPWKAVLPAADVGDVVLLRAFAVKSRRRKTYLLSTDASAWCVWRFAEQRGIAAQEEVEKPAWARRRADSDVREEVKGPPVEYGKAEKEQAVKLRAWWMASKADPKHGLQADGKQDVATAAKL